MKKVLVVMGGFSDEREISLLSGHQVADALKQSGYEVTSYDLKDVADFVETLNRERPDVVFNALHGKYGEDGCVQGLLNLMKIPYTHSGVLASSIGMDKNKTRLLAKSAGLDIAAGGLMTKEEFLNREPPRPYVVKPNDNGSSVGVFIVREEGDKEAALNAWPDGEYRLVEEYIAGRELSVAVWDNQGIGVVEIAPKTGYYDFKNKYSDGGAEHIIPAPIPADVYEKALNQAATIHKMLGCRGVSRSDFRFDPNEANRLVFLEINTNPGMTALSLVPDIMRVCQGTSYERIVSRLVEEAVCDA
ncbi:MAG: D-alanine--D-alanine ligase [Alphaproteobacteria bacterium]|nr:D-alanine--D-alanine ligase [Alphaproteobacteria bacterium]